MQRIKKVSTPKAADSLERLTAAVLSQRPETFSCHALVEKSRHFIDGLLPVFFPHWRVQPYASKSDLKEVLLSLQNELRTMVSCLGVFSERASSGRAAAFFRELPAIGVMVQQDAQAILDGDPAAESLDEVIMAYPGILAIVVHRCAHELFREKIPLLPRLLSEYAHRMTGIDIHPGAQIGRSFCIDHGTGIVIGATAVIGAHVKIYQGVTLGALSVKKTLAGRKRHPTVEDRVVIYAQAVILGGETAIGHDSIIGGNVFLTHGVPPYSLVTHKPETVVSQRALRTRTGVSERRRRKH